MSLRNEQDAAVHPVDLRTEDDSGLVACGFAAPRLSWRLSSRRAGVRQLGYELEVAGDPALEGPRDTRGFVESPRPYLVPWPSAPLASREKRWWRVRVLTDRGWTSWSEIARVEATLLAREDWAGRPVSPRSNFGRIERGPSPLLRREFSLDSDWSQARLFATALGIHDIRINDRPVSPDLLEPGWSAYRDRHLFAAYDVGGLLEPGANVISATVAEGWWRGELTWMQRRACYGDTTALLAQLEIEDAVGQRRVIATDSSWRASYGAYRLAELYDGVDVDLGLEPGGWRLPGFDDSDWESVVPLELPPVLEQRTAPPVRPVRVFAPAQLLDEGGVIRIDTGQNLAGYLRLRAAGAAGDVIAVSHAEVLDDSGRLHRAPLRNARAIDRYRLAGEDTVELEPQFTFHGFRHAEIVAPPGTSIESVEVVAIGSALDYSGQFECSDPSLDRLFRNIVWSQRGNFIALPTDCPQRDERLGWTGDIQVFAETACFIADCRSFLSGWLRDLAAEQREDGNVPSTAPNVISGHEFEYAGVGWGDAATLVPWEVYRAYGDAGVLARQYDSMRAWVEYGASRLDADGLWIGDFHLGDWLDPGAPPGRPDLATTPADFIANAYLARSAARLSASARILGRAGDAETFGRLSRDVAAAAWRRWGEVATTTQTGCAMAIMFDVAPEEEKPRVGRQLAHLVDLSEGRVATGFLGTPLVLPALSRTGQTAAAYRLLLNRQCPGWLYQVDHGATTTWERWDAVRPDGSLHQGEMDTEEGATMTSFNHYAYGAVAAWLVGTVAGLSLDRSSPGYGHILFAPEPGGGLDHASASLNTAYGPTSIAWRLAGNAMDVTVEIPPGATAEIRIPHGFVPAEGPAPILHLGSGKYFVELRRAEAA